MVTYKKAGVDDQKAEALVRFIKERAAKSFQRKMAGDIGFFAGFVPVPTGAGRSFLVGGCDGVGTKILIAKALEKYDTIGIDLVAMNCNDVAVCGATPLLFLDYLAVGKLKIEREKKILEGIIKGCEIAGCALIGGETAQMPDVYSEDDFDLAGFCVGIVDRDKMIGPAKVKEGDILLGIGSNGLHSNGFSLVRKVFFPKRGIKRMLFDYKADLGRSLGEEFLRPTFIYSPLIVDLVKRNLIHAAAHITGGGIPGNLSRILPENMDAEVYTDSWNVPCVFHMIRESGSIKTREMFNVFNMGIGLILSVSSHNKENIKSIARKFGFRVFQIGVICRGKGRVVLIKKPA